MTNNRLAKIKNHRIDGFTLIEILVVLICFHEKETVNKGIIVYYHSKSEFRLLNVPRENIRDMLKVNHLLFFRREGGNLHVTHLGPGGTHLVSEFGHSKLVQKLPRQSKKPQDQE